MTRPLLYLCVRPQADASEAEYRSFLRGTGRTPSSLHRVDLTREVFPDGATDRYAGFVVGGSPFNLSDPTSTKSEVQRRIEKELDALASATIAGQTDTFFTCYGIGIVTQLLGGEVTTDFGEEASAATIRTTAAASSDAISDALPHSFHALTAHKEGAGALPSDATLLGTNEACPAQYYRVGTHLYATQFHPEATPQEFTGRMAIYRDAGYFDPADYDRLASAIDISDVTAAAPLLRRFAERLA